MALPRSQTNPELVGGTVCLSEPGRKHEEAVKALQPYDMSMNVGGGARGCRPR